MYFDLDTFFFIKNHLIIIIFLEDQFLFLLLVLILDSKCRWLVWYSTFFQLNIEFGKLQKLQTIFYFSIGTVV